MTKILIENDVPLAPFTTFKIGGKAKYFTRIHNVEELKEARQFAENQGPTPGLPIFILGGGSNVLISDDGFSGLVIKVEILGTEWNVEGALPRIRVGAGESWDKLVEEAINRGLWGFENLSGVPGTVGASVIQNIGAYGAEIKTLVESVEVFDLDTGETKLFSNSDCQFDYRESIFKKPENKNLIVLFVTYKLSGLGPLNLSYKDIKNHFQNNSNPSLQEIREAVLAIRDSKFPNLKEVGTAGSFFKNPIISSRQFQKLKENYPQIPNWPVNSDEIKISAAWLLDKVGNFKGVSDGKVGSYKNQSLVIVNHADASALDVKKFTEEIKNKIKNRTGILLEEEVRMIE